MLWDGEGVWKQGETCLGRSPRDGERVGFRVLGLGLRVREGGSSGRGRFWSGARVGLQGLGEGRSLESYLFHTVFTSLTYFHNIFK